MENCQIFIDAEYLLQSLKWLCGKSKEKIVKKEDFKWQNFVSHILNGRKSEKLFYYTARLDEKENKATFDMQTKFLKNIETQLSAYNIKMRLGHMIKIKIKTQETWREQREKRDFTPSYTWGQKGIDTKIILDMAKAAFENEGNLSVLLVSGDEDFSDVLKLLKEKGVRTQLITFSRNDSKLSNILKSTVDECKEFDYQDCLKNNFL